VTELLKNHLNGDWIAGTGEGTTLRDPVTAQPLVRVSSAGLDLAAGFRFAREQGGAALRALTYGERAALLGQLVAVLQAHRDAYYDIATANSGTTRNDSAVDIDGAIYTLGQYAKWGVALGDARVLADGANAVMSKDGLFQSRHVWTPSRGLALFINAFNFPAWGLWEKAAPALLAGVPVVVKPGTATAWLTHRMVQDVIAAGVLPAGALSLVCGSSAGLMDALQPVDVVSFTGSAETAAIIRRHPAVAERSVRANIEADSLNAAVLMPDAIVGDASFESFVKALVPEMTVKSGQKCTAIRRAFVPEALHAAVVDAVAAKLAKVSVGNPRNESVRMGALVSREQFDHVQAGIARLAREAGMQVAFDGRGAALVDADPAVAACVAPVLFSQRDPDAADLVHRFEVFGPVATVMPCRSLDHACALVRRGEGSLVVSLFGADASALAAASLSLADLHGRVHVVSPDVAATQTGHGNVMPQSQHGGPGRAGGGAELGGLRALDFYLRRTAIQAASPVLDALGAVARPA
jgi:3,4-dehydroadipyl-CoA semialdehyde dehydrogenase